MFQGRCGGSKKGKDGNPRPGVGIHVESVDFCGDALWISAGPEKGGHTTLKGQLFEAPTTSNVVSEEISPIFAKGSV